MSKDITEKLVQLIGEYVEYPHPITLETRFIADFNLDSLQVMELVAQFEDFFDVNIPIEDLTTVRNVGDVVSIVRELAGDISDTISTGIPRFLQPLPMALWSLRHSEDTTRGFTFVSDDGESNQFHSFADIARKTASHGEALKRAGLAAGEKVALILPDSEQFVFSFFGAMHAGGVSVPIPPPAAIRQAQHYIEHVEYVVTKSESSLLITSAQIKQLLAPLISKTLREVLTIEELAPDSRELPLVSCSVRDTAFLQFTSGSTARPKGVPITFESLAANAQCIMEHGLKVTPEDIGCSWLPLYHDMGLVGSVIAPIYTETPVVHMPTLSFVKRPLRWLKQISASRATISFGPTFAYGLCAKRVRPKDLESLDLSCWRVAGCGAEPIQARTLKEFTEKFQEAGFKPEAFLPSYGLAESTLAITFSKLEDPLRVDTVSLTRLTQDGIASAPSAEEELSADIVSCGRPCPEHDLRIVSNNGSPLAEGEVGEITIRGPSVMAGYYGEPSDETPELRDGWFHTGDLGYTKNGELFICGRLKDIIIVSGNNYYPSEIEWATSQVVGIRAESAVTFGVAEIGTNTEQVIICAETAFDESRFSDLDEEIRSHVMATVGIHVDRVVLLPPGRIPRTSSGKLQRRKVRELYLSGALNITDEAAHKNPVGRLARSQLRFVSEKFPQS